MFYDKIRQQKHILIELTSRCTLACPACSRTVYSQVLKRPYPKIDLDVDALDRFFDCDAGNDLEEFIICGDYGDAIYYPHLFEFIRRFRNKRFTIVTNGSYQTAEFWHELCNHLTDKDVITFSIDGLEDTNHLYRRNSDWASTMLGLDIVAQRNIQRRWETNIFNFNLNQLSEIKEFAESRGCQFAAKKTSRFGDESLAPDEQYIDVSSLYKDSYTTDNVEIHPQCFEQRAISADGRFNPCGWITAPLTLYKSQLWRERDQWSIYSYNYEQMINRLNQWATSIQQNPDNADVICKMRCKPQQSARVVYEPRLNTD